MFSCDCFFLVISSLFVFQVCAEAFNPDEEEEDTEQRVRMSELHRAPLQCDRHLAPVCTSPSPFHVRVRSERL